MHPVRISARCKIVTPMLSSGADQQEFEIRSTSVKSGLRFWWRAFQPDEGQTLYKKEEQLFGSTELACPFSIFVKPDKSTFEYWKPGDSVGEWGEGLGYIFFSIFNGRDKKIKNTVQKRDSTVDQGKSGRPIAKPGGEFELNITFKASYSETDVKDVICSLWLLENFGGLGGRTRRGAGCFEIINIEIDSDEVNEFTKQLIMSQKNYARPELFIDSGIRFICKRWLDENDSYKIPDYTAFRPGISEILVFKNPHSGKGNGAMKAMDAIGLGMKIFRNTNPYEEARQMHHALTDEGNPVPDFKVLQKAQMGLPIIYNFRGDGRFDRGGAPDRSIGYNAKGIIWDDKKNLPIKSAKDNSERRSSPLLISCHEFGKIPYAVICHLPAPILPEGQKLWLESKPVGHDHFSTPPAGYNYVEELLIKGNEVNGDKRKPLHKYFEKCFYIRKRKVAVTPAKPVKKENKSVLETDNNNQTKIDIKPEDEKLKWLRQIKDKPGDLQWYLGETIGNFQGKKEICPCDLWYLENGEVKKDEGKWQVKGKQFSTITNLKKEKGTFFLCTKQPDQNTAPSGYLFNVKKPG